MKRPPTAYLVLFGAVVAVSALLLLVTFGVPPFDGLAVFIISNVMGFFTMLVLGVLGGIAMGMLAAHRMLANRDFTPFERSVLESLTDIRERLDKLEAREDARREGERPAEKARR